MVGETVISALALTEDSMWDSNFTVAAAHVMSPPIRSTAHRASVRQALAGGVLQVRGLLRGWRFYGGQRERGGKGLTWEGRAR